MKTYIISIIGATLLSATGSILTPDSMRKYVSVITGFIIISVIVSPLAELGDIDIFAPLKEPVLSSENYSEVYAKTVAKELEKKIEGDIKERIKTEFGITAEADAKVEVENGDIKSVSEIALRGTLLRKDIAKRLKEVYGADEVIMDGQRISF